MSRRSTTRRRPAIGGGRKNWRHPPTPAARPPPPPAPAAGVAHAWVGIGFSQTAREKYADAIDAYKTAIAAFDTLRREEDGGRARLGLALAQAGAEQFAASLETAARVRSIADRLVNDDLR